MQDRSFLPKTIRLAALTAMGVIALDIVAFSLLPIRYLYPFSFARASLPVQAAVILFHDFADSESSLSPESRRRLHYGMNLLLEEKAGVLLLCGGNRPESGRNGARLMADYLLRASVPATRILVEDSSWDTVSNLAAASRILRQEKIVHAGLVSSPYHLLRIKHLDKGVEKYVLLPYPVPSAVPPPTRREIWLSAHHNLAAWLAAAVLPKDVYRVLVNRAREQADR